MHKILTITVCASAFLIFSNGQLAGQCNNTPCPLPQPDVNPMTACVVDEPNDMTCYNGVTNAEPSVVFPNWCGSNINTQWLAFTATTAYLHIPLTVYSCTQGNALQAALFSSPDCVNFTMVANCITVQQMHSAGIYANNLIPGQVYYLCIGGQNGAICNYELYPPGWSGFAENCAFPSLVGPYHAYPLDAVWTVEPPTAATLNPPIGAVTTITWLEPGTHNLCVSSSNCPISCNTVEVLGGIFEEYIDLCEGSTVECAGHVYSAPGVYTVTEPDGLFCTKTTHCNINLIPKSYLTDTVYMCQNGSATCAGEEFSSAGTYPINLTGYKGCDSIVTCKIINYPSSPVSNLMINLCGPAEYQVCNTMYNSSGVYTEICTNWRGCDSLINLNLAILDPQAVINPPSVLACQGDTTVTLNGGSSSVNTALGGLTLYNWTGPGIVSNANLPTIQVNQPGTYCLVLTHARGGLFCRDTACVDVIQSFEAPALPQISGNTNPCFGSVYIYTATATGAVAPSSFNWTLPGNQAFTMLTPNSIQVNWDTVITGSICVAAGNSCGFSQAACLPLVVQSPAQQPIVSGPVEVCVNGGAYLYTLNLEENGVTYNWTIPPGAVLSGSSDSVFINFQGATTGQVCVSPQNFCGTGAAVCKNIQVNPVPAADLNGDTQICPGDSVRLYFGLTGNGPFDVSWTDGTQVFTLNDVQDGYSEPVYPTQTTVYTITGISDNSSATCSSSVSDSLSVRVWPIQATMLSAQICAGESLVVGGASQTNSGTYVDTLNTFHGCDSLIITALSVLSMDTTLLDAVTCDPQMAGFNTQVLTQMNGCDSLVITSTMLQSSDTTYLHGNSCNPANLGVFTQHLSNVYGCDSMVVTTVDFALADTTLLDATTCNPNALGVFINQLTSFDGCDSIVVTTVSLLPSHNTVVSGITCNPANAGVFTTVLTNQLGCDSIITTTVNFIPLLTTFLASTTCDPVLAGVFTNHLSTAGGCDSVVVTDVSLLPSSTTSLSGFSCNPAAAGVFTEIFTNQFGCDSTVVTTIGFTPLPPTLVSSTTCDPALAGIFTSHYTSSGGCDSTVVATVNLLPASQVSLATTTCDPALAGVFVYHFTNQYGCDSIVTETRTLLPDNTVHHQLYTCDPAQVGSATISLTNQYGCDSVVVTNTSLLPMDDCSVDAIFTGSTVSCITNSGSITLTPTVGTAPFAYTVFQGANAITSGTIPALGVSQVVGNLSAGSYSVQISSPNGLSTSSQATVLPPNLPVVAGVANSDFQGFQVSCQGAMDGSAMASSSGGTPPYLFSWSNGITNQQVDMLAAGTYTVTVTDAKSCSNIASITLNAPQTLMIASTTKDPDCAGQNEGLIQIEASGGVTPFQYALNNGTAQSAKTFMGLSPGTYTLSVTDANGCSQTDAVEIHDVLLPEVELGDDIQLELGDEAILLAVVNVPVDSLLFAIWSPLIDSLDCNPQICLTLTVSPLVTTVYTIRIQTLNGCTDEDNLTVSVNRRRQIFVPNVFSPNGDGANDLLTVYAKPGSTTNVRAFHVYDRWGEELYFLNGFLPNNPILGWDGTYKGDSMSPGVYVWVAEIEFVDGQVSIFTGDVTLVR